VITRAVICVAISLTGAFGQFEPAGPGPPTGGDDLDSGVLVVDVERAAVSAQPRPRRVRDPDAVHHAADRAVDLQLDQQLNHAGLVRRRVGRLLDQRVELSKRIEHRLAVGPVRQREHLRPGEKVLHVEGREG